VGLSLVSQILNLVVSILARFSNSRTCELGLKTGFDFMYT